MKKAIQLLLLLAFLAFIGAAFHSLYKTAQRNGWKTDDDIVIDHQLTAVRAFFAEEGTDFYSRLAKALFRSKYGDITDHIPADTGEEIYEQPLKGNIDWIYTSYVRMTLLSFCSYGVSESCTHAAFRPLSPDTLQQRSAEHERYRSMTEAALAELPDDSEERARAIYLRTGNSEPYYRWHNETVRNAYEYWVRESKEAGLPPCPEQIQVEGLHCVRKQLPRENTVSLGDVSYYYLNEQNEKTNIPFLWSIGCSIGKHGDPNNITYSGFCDSSSFDTLGQYTINARIAPFQSIHIEDLGHWRELFTQLNDKVYEFTGETLW